jgi:hypothetical protein
LAEHGICNARIVGMIPGTTCMFAGLEKCLWIKASAK